MVGNLVALRLRLLSASAGSPKRVLGLVLTAFAVGTLTALATVMAVIAGLAPDPDGTVVVAAVAGLWLAWVLVPVLGPLIGAGVDETLDPSAMALLPVRGRELMPGMLAAGMIGIAPLATTIAVTGLAASHVRSVAGGFLAAAAMIVIVTLCVGSGRAVATALSRRAASRRRRDAGIVAGAVLLASGALTIAPLLLRDAGGGALLTDVLGWTPAGQLGLALREVRLDDAGAAGMHIAIGLGVVALILLAWARSIDRALVMATGQGGSQRTRSAIAALTAWLPTREERVAAIAAKEILLTVRDPMRRSTWLVAWLVGCAAPLYLTIGQGNSEASTLLVALPAFLAVGGINLNGFGLDGTAIWTQISSAVSLRADLRGRALAMLAVNLPCVVLVAPALAILGGHPASAPLGVAAGIAVLLAVLGAGAVVSVRAPVPRARTAFGVSPGLSGHNMLVSVAAILVSLLCLAPGVVALAAGLAGWTPGLYLCAPLLLACGSGAFAVGLRIAANAVDDRQPELLHAVSPQHA
ncbi:MAG: hypothetical protein Q8O56_04690 [Solirubrobacteraceae bacterium]|nr:hypothetical protein [Solirubrobacteraceae bacterium]